MQTALSTDNGQYHVLASNNSGEVIAAFSLIVAYDPADSNSSLDVKHLLDWN